MTLTPTELGLLLAIIGVSGVVVGGVIAGGFAILSGWLENRREQRRWLRQERYSIYLDVARMLDRLRHDTLGMQSAEGIASREEALELAAAAKSVTAELIHLSPSLFIVGPRRVSIAFVRCVGALGRLAGGLEGAVDEYAVLRAQFIRDVQDVLQAGKTRERVDAEDAFIFKEIAEENAQRGN